MSDFGPAWSAALTTSNPGEGIGTAAACLTSFFSLAILLRISCSFDSITSFLVSLYCIDIWAVRLIDFFVISLLFFWSSLTTREGFCLFCIFFGYLGDLKSLSASTQFLEILFLPFFPLTLNMLSRTFLLPWDASSIFSSSFASSLSMSSTGMNDTHWFAWLP